jgi:hypothetical protein
MCESCVGNLRYLVEKLDDVSREDYDHFRSTINEDLTELLEDVENNFINMYGVLDGFFKLYEICGYLWRKAGSPHKRYFAEAEPETKNLGGYLAIAIEHSSSKMTLKDAEIALSALYKLCRMLDLCSAITLQTFSRFSKYNIVSVAIAKPTPF